MDMINPHETCIYIPDVKEEQEKRTERIRESQAEYYQRNKIAINEKRKIYMLEYNQRTFTCLCGDIIKNGSKCTHMKSKRHLQRLENINAGIPADTRRGNVKVVCACGGKYFRKNIKQHLQSTKHMNYVDAYNEISNELPIDL